MKALLTKFDRLLENRIRLAIMSLLMVEEDLDFNTLKETIGLTDGNLASHMSMLEKNRYVQVHKRFRGRKPRTTYTATAKGRKAFSNHLEAVEALIRRRQ